MAVETCVIGVKQKGNQENGHPRDTGNSGHKTQNEEKQQNKATQKSKTISNTDPVCDDNRRMFIMMTTAQEQHILV